MCIALNDEEMVAYKKVAATARDLGVTEQELRACIRVVNGVDDTDAQLRGEFITESCPRCGASLLMNKRGDKWCSNPGSNNSTACHYGLGTSAQAVLYGGVIEPQSRQPDA